MTKKSVYKVVVCALVLSFLSINAISFADEAEIANSITGFSNVQGQNGWSYYGKHFSESVWSELTYDANADVWSRGESFGWVAINATSQTMLEGNAMFTRRIWTSDTDYAPMGGVKVRCEYDQTVTAGAGLYFYDASSGTETQLAFRWSIGSGVWTATITDFGVGDKIITYLQNSGDGQGSFTWQYMAVSITANIPNPPRSIYGSIVDFAQVQQQDGWEYGAVLTADVNDLANNLIYGTYDFGNNRWQATITDVGHVHIYSDSQNMLEDEGLSSFRSWTAGQDYSDLRIRSLISTEITAGFGIYLLDAATSETSEPLMLNYSTDEGILSGSGIQEFSDDFVIPSIHTGDKLFFCMIGSGDGQGSGTPADWNVTIGEPSDCDEVVKYGFTFKADIDKDCKINQIDYSKIAADWNTDYIPAGNSGINPDDPNDPFVYDSVAGYSGVQGENGWYYGYVGFAGVSDLYANANGMGYSEATGQWSNSIVSISQTAQQMIEGNAIFSLRYWEAPVDCVKLDIRTKIQTPVTAGFIIYFVDIESQETTSYGGVYSHQDAIDAGDGVEDIELNLIISNITAGDRVYFCMQNSGDGQGGQTFADWQQTIVVLGPEDCADLVSLGKAMSSDLNNDCLVDITDLRMVIDQWLNSNDPLDSGI